MRIRKFNMTKVWNTVPEGQKFWHGTFYRDTLESYKSRLDIHHFTFSHFPNDGYVTLKQINYCKN